MLGKRLSYANVTSEPRALSDARRRRICGRATAEQQRGDAAAEGKRGDLGQGQEWVASEGRLQGRSASEGRQGRHRSDRACRTRRSRRSRGRRWPRRSVPCDASQRQDPDRHVCNRRLRRHDRHVERRIGLVCLSADRHPRHRSHPLHQGRRPGRASVPGHPRRALRRRRKPLHLRERGEQRHLESQHSGHERQPRYHGRDRGRIYMFSTAVGDYEVYGSWAVTAA